RFSVTLIFSPRNIASVRPRRSHSSASRTSNRRVSSVMRFLEKSRKTPAASAVSRSPRPGSAGKRCRRGWPPVCSQCHTRAVHAGRRVSGGEASLIAGSSGTGEVFDAAGQVGLPGCGRCTRTDFRSYRRAECVGREKQGRNCEGCCLGGAESSVWGGRI